MKWVIFLLSFSLLGRALDEIPPHLYDEYTLGREVPVYEWHQNPPPAPSPIIANKKEIDLLVPQTREKQICYNGATDKYLYALLNKYASFLEGKSVAVISRVAPWYESIVLAYGGHPTTLASNEVISLDPRIQAKSLDEYWQNPIAFDVVLSISSVEHEGLGGYGDPLNPNGDFEAMKELRRMLKPDGLLLMALPVGEDSLYWNTHRVYGNLRLPLLFQGWELLESSGFSNSDLFATQYVGHIPVFLLRPQSFDTAVNEKPFVVIIPSYNNRRWYAPNIASALSQNYQNFRIIFINDASTDGTGDCVQKYVDRWERKDKVTLIHNEKNQGALANIYRAVHLCSPDEIVVNVDGDDWLSDGNVLNYLNHIYQNPDVWVTYGQFKFHPYGSIGWTSEVPREIIARNAYREFPWKMTHLKTYYASLFQRIKKEDLLYAGKFYPMSGDLGFMFPIAEMAGFHSRFISDILYVYNVETPFNDMKVAPARQQAMDLLIRLGDRYAPLEEL